MLLQRVVEHIQAPVARPVSCTELSGRERHHCSTTAAFGKHDERDGSKSEARRSQRLLSSACSVFRTIGLMKSGLRPNTSGHVP